MSIKLAKLQTLNFKNLQQSSNNLDFLLNEIDQQAEDDIKLLTILYTNMVCI